MVGIVRLSCNPQYYVLLHGAWFAHGHITNDQPIYRVSDGATITFQQMMNELKGTQVVIIGESHDSPEHHQLQLAIIHAYRQTEAPLPWARRCLQPKANDTWIAGQAGP